MDEYRSVSLSAENCQKDSLVGTLVSCLEQKGFQVQKDDSMVQIGGLGAELFSRVINRLGQTAQPMVTFRDEHISDWIEGLVLSEMGELAAHLRTF